MPNSDEPAVEDLITQPIHCNINSVTDGLSTDPKNQVNRLISPLPQDSHDSIDADTNENHVNSHIPSSFTKSVTEKDSRTRERITSVKLPLSESNNQSQKLQKKSSTSPDLSRPSTAQTKKSNASTIPEPGTIDTDFNFSETYKTMIELAERSCSYFSKQSSNDACQKFERLLSLLLHSLELSLPLIDYIIENFHRFDYSPKIPANGYRTLVVSHGQASLRTLDILKQVDAKRDGILFNLMFSSGLFQDLDCWTKTLIAIQHILMFCVKLMNYSDEDELYVDADKVPKDVELDYFKIVAFDSEYFFGSTCGFQFAESLERMFAVLLAGLATYYEAYNRSIPVVAATIVTAPKYLLFPEQRATKCAAILRDCDYLFCKGFWNIVEHDLIKTGSRVITPNVTVSKYFCIGPKPIEIDSIIIPPPSPVMINDKLNENKIISNDSIVPNVQQEEQYINLKLLSHAKREGMDQLPLKKADLEISSKKILPMSDELFMHVHGGGFIATTSTTHEVYVKPWALGLEIPIVSIDYSLAPENPFPRAVEECFYAYAWILKNASKLGWNGKRILLVGDSAGGNLVTIVTIKAIQAGLRKPDALICFYTPFLLSYSMSPSRLLAIMDPLLNTSFLMRCLAAYTGIKLNDESDKNEALSKTNGTNHVAETKQQTKSVRPSDNQVVPIEEYEPQEVNRTPEDLYQARLIEIIGPRQAYLLQKLRNSTLPYHPHLSPLLAPDEIIRQFPTTYLIPCARDPFIDDNVEFARRLRALDVPHHMTVVDQWPHGYLDFGFASNEVAKYNNEIVTFLKSIVEQSVSNNPDDMDSLPTFMD